MSQEATAEAVATAGTAAVGLTIVGASGLSDAVTMDFSTV